MALTRKQIQDYKKAGEIASQAVKFAKKIIKPGMKLFEIADKIEAEIEKLGGKCAFPVNLAIDDVAAHFTPASDSEEVASGLLKVDIGVHVNGDIADTAFSLDLTKEGKYKELIASSQEALDNAIKVAEKNATLSEIGKTIQDTITNKGFSPVRNLSGHELGSWMVHAGITIPNYENNNQAALKEGAYAIEPFSTTGTGIVYDAGKSGIYRLEKEAGVRDSKSREIYNFILKEYKTLPFCERWISKKFGSRAKLALLFLEQAGILHHYAQLIEKSHAPVSQAEHTVLILKDKTEVTTR